VTFSSSYRSVKPHAKGVTMWVKHLVKPTFLMLQLEGNAVRYLFCVMFSAVVAVNKMCHLWYLETHSNCDSCLRKSIINWRIITNSSLIIFIKSWICQPLFVLIVLVPLQPFLVVFQAVLLPEWDDHLPSLAFSYWVMNCLGAFIIFFAIWSCVWLRCMDHITGLG